MDLSVATQVGRSLSLRSVVSMRSRWVHRLPSHTWSMVLPNREFKWLSVEGEAKSPSLEHYFCPYCGTSATPDEWLTLEQRAYIETAVFDGVQCILPT